MGWAIVERRGGAGAATSAPDTKGYGHVGSHPHVKRILKHVFFVRLLGGVMGQHASCYCQQVPGHQRISTGIQHTCDNDHSPMSRACSRYRHAYEDITIGGKSG
jgi:hypothetical protein